MLQIREDLRTVPAIGGDWSQCVKRQFPSACQCIVARSLMIAVMGSVLIPQNATGTLLPAGGFNDERLSLIYNADDGELAVDLADMNDLGFLEVRSESGIFIGERPGILHGPFDVFDRSLISLFRQSGGEETSFSFGTIVTLGLSEQFLLDDLTATARAFTNVTQPIDPVDLIYVPVPEPTSIELTLLGLVCVACLSCRRSN